MLHLETPPPPGDPSAGVVYLRIVLSPEQALLAPRPTPKLEDHPLSAVHDCLFNLFAATLLIGGRSSIRNLRTRHAVVTDPLHLPPPLLLLLLLLPLMLPPPLPPPPPLLLLS